MTIPGHHIRKRLLRNKGALFGLTVILISVLTAIFAYFLAPDGSPDANRIIVEIGGRPPGFRQLFLQLKKERQPPSTGFLHRLLDGREDLYDYIPINSIVAKGDSVIVQKFVDEGVERAKELYPLSRPSILRPHKNHITFWLGTDKYGRDILSRLLIGVPREPRRRTGDPYCFSLTIGVAAVGALAGYFGGRVDELILWLINVIWSIPTLLLVFAIMLLLGKGFWQVFIAIGLTLWVNVARIVRGQVLAIREREYVEAAKALGYSHPRILFRHILPNVMGPVWVVAASNFASAIVIEAGLSFLGVGVQPPQPSWGLMIKENYNFIITHNPMLALAPGLAIMLLVLAFNLLGNSLRDMLNVRI